MEKRSGWYWQRFESSCGLWANVAVETVGHRVALRSVGGNTSTWKVAKRGGEG